MNTQTKFNLPIGFYTTQHIIYKSVNEQSYYFETIQLLKVNDKTITIKCSDFDKPITRKPKQITDGFYIEIKTYKDMGRESPTIFNFSKSYYTDDAPTKEELENDFIAGEIILKTEEPKKKNTNKEVFDTLNYLINNNFKKEYDSMVDRGYWMMIEGTNEIYTKIMDLETNIKSVINLQNELVKLTEIHNLKDGIFYEIQGDHDVYKMIKKCLGTHYKKNYD